MNLPRFVCYLLSCQVFLVILMTSEVSAQGLGILAEMAAVLGVVPVSQLLFAGAGLISLKFALIVKLLTLLGIIPERRVPLITDESENEVEPKLLNQPSFVAPEEPSEYSTDSPAIASPRLFGMPSVTTLPPPESKAITSPSLTPSSSPSPSPPSEVNESAVDESDGGDFTVLRTIQLPQPSIRSTDGQFGLLLNETDFPLPFFLESLHESADLGSDKGSTSPPDTELETSESRVSEASGNFILYPMVYNEFSPSDGLRFESGYAPSNSGIKIQYANGTIAPLPDVIDEPIEVIGLKFVSFNRKAGKRA